MTQEVTQLESTGNGVKEPERELISESVGESNISIKKEAPKKYTKPSGKLLTSNVGIKSTLNPKKKEAEEIDEENFTPTNKEPFTFEELEKLWKEYALKLKRDRRDLLHSTLANSELSMSSDYQITLEIDNSIQSVELEREKSTLVGFLRTKLKNDFLTFNYIVTESSKIEIMDSKSSFERLAEENKSLHKFRKLFNLDVEF